MARIRSIKPEFWTDEKVVALSPLARLLFIGMWNFADDEGRGEFSAARLKMQILPADPADISELLGEIRREGMVSIYRIEGKEYFQVNGFCKHQKVDHRVMSKHPSPPSSPEIPRNVPPDQGRDQGSRIKEGKGSRSAPNGATRAIDSEFRETFWLGYPHKVGKGEALKAYRGARQKANAEEIAAGVERYRASKPPDREWCNPATFLNQERWLDEPAQVATSPPKPFYADEICERIEQQYSRDDDDN